MKIFWLRCQHKLVTFLLLIQTMPAFSLLILTERSIKTFHRKFVFPISFRHFPFFNSTESNLFSGSNHSCRGWQSPLWSELVSEVSETGVRWPGDIRSCCHVSVVSGRSQSNIVSDQWWPKLQNSHLIV